LIYREFSNASKNGYKHDPTAKKYGREALFVILERLFDDQPKPKKEKKSKKKKDPYKAMFRNIADMESDGVHFPEDIKKQLVKMREELHCEYSGLPSPAAYKK
jgi:hypothetical protein